MSAAVGPGTAAAVEAIMQHDPSGTRPQAAPDSPLERLRASYEARIDAQPRYVDVRPPQAPFGALVMQVGRSADVDGARGVMRTMAALSSDTADTNLTITADDLADVIASATTGLHERQEGGDLVALHDDDGSPLTFGPSLGAALGYAQVVVPRDVVLLAFTEAEGDGPPTVDILRLMLCATAVAGMMIVGSSDAASAVGKASTTGT